MDSSLKRQRLGACASSSGIMCALAIDQGSSLTRALAEAAGDDSAGDERAAEFKTTLAKHLSPEVSAILLDYRFGDACQAVCAPETGVLRAYETDVYGGSCETVTTLPAQESVFRLAQRGADAIKLHMYYDPDAPEEENEPKRALIERVGAECLANDLPFLFEPLAVRRGLDSKTAAFAAVKPGIVRRSVEEFSKPGYRVDVLKIEFPVELSCVDGIKTAAGPGKAPAYTKQEAMDHFRATATAAGCPFVFLSAGVTLDEYAEGLELAGEAGVAYSGFLCGRAIWRPAINIFGQGGVDALAQWARTEGQAGLKRLTKIAHATAVPMIDRTANQAPSPRPAIGGMPQ